MFSGDGLTVLVRVGRYVHFSQKTFPLLKYDWLCFTNAEGDGRQVTCPSYRAVVIELTAGFT